MNFIGVNDSQMPERFSALSLASADEPFPLAGFDQFQKHGQIQCEKIGNSVFSSCVFFSAPAGISSRRRNPEETHQ